ncbi:MAG: dihydrofolate reductase [Bacteroidales bacterium]|nr:dihydrofolate reductase [Bacteroidales bacterium]
MISIIVAVAENMAIGKDNQLLWHISEDLKRFKILTSGHTVVMGRNTWLSLPKRPLPHRINIVITDNPTECFEGCLMVNSIEAAIAKCPKDEESFVMGGASIYRQFMPLADRLYVTRVDQPFEGDTFFPEIKPEDWKILEQSTWFDIPDGSFRYRFENYSRIESKENR